jgi:hypothetical protein
MTRDEWKEVEDVLRKPDVKTAMRGRCEEQGHDWENGADVMFNVYQFCKWCGKRR